MDNNQCSNNSFITAKQILTDAKLPVDQKIDQLVILLQQETTIEVDTVKLINRFIKGNYGIEYLVMQEKEEKIIDFYQYLQRKFPGVIEISLTLADLLLLNRHYSDSFNIFNKAFEKQPMLIFEAPGELLDMLEKYGNDEQKIFYHLSLVRAFIEDQNFEDALEEYQEIIQKYGNQNKSIKNYLKKNELSYILEWGKQS